MAKKEEKIDWRKRLNQGRSRQLNVPLTEEERQTIEQAVIRTEGTLAGFVRAAALAAAREVNDEKGN